MCKLKVYCWDIVCWVLAITLLVGLGFTARADKQDAVRASTFNSSALECPFSPTTKNVCDGEPARVVSTTRSTAVPCQGAITNLCLNSTTPTAWGAIGSPTVTDKGGGWFEIVDDDTGTGEGFVLVPGLSMTAGERVSISCHVKPGTTGVQTQYVRLLGPDSQYCQFGADSFATITGETDATCTLTALTTASASIQLRQNTGNSGTGSIQVSRCQVEKAASIGSRCDSGATAATCYGGSEWGTAAINTACIAPGGVAGVESYAPVTNYVTNSTTPTSWTSVNATVSGQTITDDDAAAFEGAYTQLASPGTGPITMSCYVAAGTSTKVRLQLNSDGTGGTGCNFNGLTATPQRVSCPITLGGTPTFVNSVVYVGNATSDTGSVVVSQCQTEKASTPGRRCDSGGTATTCGADQHTVSTTGFPTASGEIEIEYRPATSDLSGTYYLLDGRVSGVANAPVLLLFSNRIQASRAGNNADSAILAWGAVHLIKVRWSGSAVTVYRDGTLVASSSTWGSDAPWGSQATIGARFTNTLPANGTVRILYVGDIR